MADLTAALEAILFAAGESMPVARLSLVLGAEEEEILRCASELAEQYEKEERGIRLLWVAQDLLDPRTISKRDMRRQVNLYMQTVMGEEPVRPDLVDFDDALTW